MALGYHTYHGDGDAPPLANASPGLQARVQQVKAAYVEQAEATQAARESGRGTTGPVSVRKQTEVAQNALERQIRYQRGQYPVR